MIEVVGVLSLFALFFLLIISTQAFWIWMIVDCVQRDFKKKDEKIIWLLIIILVQVVGASVYYFVIKREADKK